MTMTTLDARVSGRCAQEIARRPALLLCAMRGLCLPLCLFTLGGSNAVEPPASATLPATAPDAAPAAAKPEESPMWMTVGDRRFAITPADNETARAFAALLPQTLEMADLNGNEKYASLPQALPTNALRPEAIRNGDLMLYGADTLVVFYLNFETPYSYTRLGRLVDPAGLAQVLHLVVDQNNPPLSPIRCG